ncbi:MAG: dTMP kinase [Cellvibrionaceae bacterium]|jgi:dTMP kinase
MFISFEGSEGSGKTTQINMLADYLQAQGKSVIVTRQPGGTEIGRQIRQVLHDVGNGAMTSSAEILLYSADRAQHVEELIRPTLAQGTIVLCDRYTDSTFAYQGYGRGLDIAALKMITEFATGGLKPDLSFFLYVDVQEGLRRREVGNLEMNRMDLQKKAFYDRVEQGYRAMIAADIGRWHEIDASVSIEAVQIELRKVMDAAI